MSAYLSQSTKLASDGRYSGSSYWCGTNDNAWLQVDLGKVIIMLPLFRSFNTRVGQNHIEKVTGSYYYITIKTYLSELLGINYFML